MSKNDAIVHAYVLMHL